MTTQTSTAQQWLDTESYPFEHQYLELDAGTMHYVDEGEGEVILFVHGTPTWSFLYRDYIKSFSATHRCIAIDHLGFGLSDKPTDFSGKPQDHARNLETFILELDLKDITLVVHDFGGPIGLAAAIEQPDRIQRIVLANSWLWATRDDPATLEIDKLLNSELGEQYYLDMNFSAQVLLKQAFYDSTKLSEDVHQQYTSPFPDRDSRLAMLNIGKALVGESDWYQKQWEQLDKLENKEWLFLWGKHDPFLNIGYLDRWKARFPNVKFHTLESGHFIQEEQPEESIRLIREFIQ